MITLRSPGMKPSPVITTFTPKTSSSKDYGRKSSRDGGRMKEKAQEKGGKGGRGG